MEDRKLTEFEKPGNRDELLFEINLMADRMFVGNISKFQFSEILRQIMPPTCSPNERKFLDRIKEIGYVSVSGLNLENETMLAILNKAMFPDVNLSELVEKKDE